MTEKEKEQIRKFRRQGMGYLLISKKMNMSVNSIKTFCRRHELHSNEPGASRCEQCGRPVVQQSGRKKKRFCCDSCRMRWWNTHADQVKRKALYDVTCTCCGETFTAYGNKIRKYCSHACYIEDRFGGEKR